MHPLPQLQVASVNHVVPVPDLLDFLPMVAALLVFEV
jgi:hypothetical protein